MKFKNLPDTDERKRNYKGYDLTKFGTYFAVISIIVNRDGESDIKIPVFFDGKCCIYEELPNFKDTKALQVYYDRIEKYKKEEMQERKEIIEFRQKNLAIKPTLPTQSSTLFFSYTNKIYKEFGKSKIKKYLCNSFSKLINLIK